MQNMAAWLWMAVSDFYEMKLSEMRYFGRVKKASKEICNFEGIVNNYINLLNNPLEMF